MDGQLKRGMLDICVLSSLLKEESYGYKIIKDLSLRQVEISESTLYPILRRLESSGALTVHSKEYNGRLRKYYSITQTGKQRISEFLEEWKSVMTVYSYIRKEMEEDE